MLYSGLVYMLETVLIQPCPANCGSHTCVVLPRILHGSELWLLEPKQIVKLEAFQQHKLRQLQGIADRASNASVLGLIRIRPLEAEIDYRIIVTFRNIASAAHCIVIGLP
jgi:hypothetical protein